MRSTILATLLLLLGACSQGGKGTPVALRLTLSSVATTLGAAGEGGFAIYGVASNGAAFGRVVTSEAPILLELPNGSWTFYALAWEGDGNGTHDDDLDVMKGAVRCAETAPITLNGSAVAVPISLSNAQCDTATFKGTLPMGGTVPSASFRSPILKSCNDLSSVASFSANCQYDVGAGLYSRGYASGVRLSLRSFDRAPGGGLEWRTGEIVGNCLADDSATAPGDLVVPVTGTAVYNIPHSTSFPMGLVAKVYYGLSQAGACNTALGESTVSIPQGTLSESVIGGTARARGYTDGAALVHTYLRVDAEMACGATKVDPNSWAGGFGSPNAPHLICRDENLSGLRGASYTTHNFKHFILLRNLNYWFGLNPETGGPPNVAPLGDDLPGPANAFVGSFNGNGKLIIGWNTEVPSDNGIKENVGFFRSVGAGATVFNFTMIAPEVRAEFGNRTDNVGIVAGKNLGLIKDITIRGAQVRGSVSVGGVAGLMEGSGNLKNIRVYDSEIEGVYKIGGLVGHSAAWNGTGAIVQNSGVYESQVLAEDYNFGRCVDTAQNSGMCVDINEEWRDGFCGLTLITAESGCTTPVTAVWLQGSHLGGLIGKADDANIPKLDRSRFSGIVSGAAVAGGLIGFASNDIVIQDSYSTATVVANTPSLTSNFRHRTGGLVGRYPGGGGLIITRSYHDKGGVSHGLPERKPIVGLGTYAATDVIAHTTATQGTLIDGVTGTKNQDEIGMFADETYDATWDTAWTHYDLGLAAPILTWEDSADHPCIGKRAAITGSGTAADPFLVCTRDQFSNLEGSSAHFKLLDDIDLRDFAGANVITSFSGTLQGNRRGLTNFSSSSMNSAIFLNLAASGSLLNFYASNVTVQAAAQNGGAAVAINNDGLIDRTRVYGAIEVRGESGGIVVVNNGVILRADSAVTQALNVSSATSRVGGIAAENFGIIGLSEARGSLNVNASSGFVEFIGGIAGVNDGSVHPSVTATIKPGETVSGTGLIFESAFRGDIRTAGSAPLMKIGGIAGENADQGVIKDSFAEWRLSDTSNSSSNSSLDNLAGLAGSLSASSSLETSWSRFHSNFAMPLLPASLIYPGAPPVVGATTDIKFLDDFMMTMYPSFDTGDGDKVFTQLGTNDSPTPGDLYANQIASYANWSISDDESSGAKWILRPGEVFGPRLNRLESGDKHMDYFDTYSGTQP